MNIEVRYFSRTGNTRKIADSIAKKAGVQAQDCSVPIAESTDLLFLGAAVYGFGVDEKIKDFISKLDPGKVKEVALFGTSAISGSGNNKMAKMLAARGIKVSSQRFHCKGAYSFANKGRPNAEDLKNAESFALSAINEAK